MAFTEDFADFINSDTPGYQVATVGGNSLAGIFVDEYAKAQAGMAGMSGSEQVFYTTDAGITSAGVTIGSTVTIASTAYVVSERQPDGTGMSNLVLTL